MAFNLAGKYKGFCGSDVGKVHHAPLFTKLPKGNGSLENSRELETETVTVFRFQVTVTVSNGKTVMTFRVPGA
jgi:hypothetical protein